MWAYARVDSVREDQLELFKKAGINWLCLGIEAGNQEVRKEIEKGRFQKVNIRAVVKSINDHGINILGNYITNENVIRNSLLVDEGDAFNEILVNKSINEIKTKRLYTIDTSPSL